MLSEKKRTFLETLQSKFGNNTINRDELKEFLVAHPELKWPSWLTADKDLRAGRGEFTIPYHWLGDDYQSSSTMEKVDLPEISQDSIKGVVVNTTESDYEISFIPEVDSQYVAWGNHKTVESVIKSKLFYPVFVTGLSGNGKTFMVEQACSRAKRPMVRVQMSRETDEDDLIGGFRLIDGETRFMKGPILRAMELGAVLLIDEADRADPGKVMCIQGVLEGKPYYVKKTGEVVKPEVGFNIIVTANTKGKGSDDGRYVAATILDDAWLERFPITIEQHFPSDAVEKKILRSHGLDEDFITHLVAWSAVIRKTFMEGAIDELISTRRLVHIAKTYALFSDRMRAIELCINRFDEETKMAFLELYAKVDPTVVPETPVESDAELDALADSLALDSSDSASS